MDDIQRQELLYRSLIDPNGIVFDIGANVGNRSAMFASMCNTVIAVEPQEKLFNHLRLRFRNGTNVEPVRAAVGSGSTKAILYYPSDDSLGRHGIGTLSTHFMEAMGPKIFNLDKGWDLQQEVFVLTLDDLIERYGKPSFIKIDVEGYELEVVKGLNEKVDGLSFEFHPQLPEETRQVIERLQALGFTQFNYCLAETFEWQSNWTTGEGLINQLKKFDGVVETYGDCYAR